MIRNPKTPRWLQTAFCSLALAGSASLCVGQGVNDYIVNQFTNGIGAWSGNYGSAPITITHDPLENQGPGASPGAMKVVIDFNLCTGLIQRDFESNPLPDTLDLTTYSKLHFSVKVDPSSSRLSDWGGGAFGSMRFHVRPSSWASDDNIGSNNSTSEQWVGSDAYGTWKDYVLDIDHTTGLASKTITGILGIDIWSGWGSCAAPVGHTNTVTFWMDNIWFEKVVGPPPPPPTVDLTKAGVAGVQITMDSNGDQWQRDAIATPATPGNCFWNDASPVTYSFTIADFPDTTAHPDFEAHMYIVNRDTSTAFDETYGGCDWNAADIAIVSIQANSNGFNASFQIKTNRPNNNPINDITNIPAVLHTTAILGTWSLTFTDGTNVTLSGPGGASTNFVIGPDAVANNFSPAASFLQFGFHKNDGPNNGHNNGVSGTYSRIRKVGGAYQFDDTFNGATYTNNYPWRKTSASAVQHVPVGTAWLLNWTLPAISFNPQSATAVTGPWNDILTSSYQSSGKAHVQIPVGGSAGYFRLIKRTFSQLQVLMPGETPAPNTPTGKTGTPTNVSIGGSGGATDVIVRAVDADWNLINDVTDTINLTSTDTGATLPINTAMVGGVATFTGINNFLFGTQGTWTITATNMSKVMPTATSAPVSVVP